MLAWPAYAILKHYWPGATVCALVPPYTAEIARLCPWIDEVLIDEGTGIWQLGRIFRRGRFDALLALYSTSRVALAGALSRIPYRLAPASKVFQFLYSHRLVQRRSRSEKPEYAYNIDLVYRLLRDLHGDSLDKTSLDIQDNSMPAVLTRPLLSFPNDECEPLRQQLCEENHLDPLIHLVFLHPGSGGSANNLSADQYAALANGIHSHQPLAFVITAGPGEEKTARKIATAITVHPAITLQPLGGLTELARYLQLADLFISCSTGPLHIAGALNRPTAAFYPRHRSGSPLRWQTLNSPENRLVFTPPAEANEKEVTSIDVMEAVCKINEHLLKWTTGEPFC